MCSRVYCHIINFDERQQKWPKFEIDRLRSNSDKNIDDQNYKQVDIHDINYKFTE